MVIGTSDIDFSEIQTEFGGSNPISLNEYYSNGLYVPKGHSINKTSGAISTSNFSGKRQSHNFVTESSQAVYDKYSNLIGYDHGWTGSGGIGSINSTNVHAYYYTGKYGQQLEAAYTWRYCFWSSAYNGLYLAIDGDYRTSGMDYIRVGTNVWARTAFTRTYYGSPNFYTVFYVSATTNPFTGTNSYRTRVGNYFTAYGEDE